jgi:hypothetical protein
MKPAASAATVAAGAKTLKDHAAPSTAAETVIVERKPSHGGYCWLLL